MSEIDEWVLFVVKLVGLSVTFGTVFGASMFSAQYILKRVFKEKG